MTHPIVSLQAALVAALRTDSELGALIGDAVFDGPPKEAVPPYVAIARHDVLAREGDLAPGSEHRILLHVWAADASRKAALAIVERVVAVALTATLTGGALRVTHRQHERTDTAMDRDTGLARAAVALRLFTEPTA
jgi:hypothetical protein